MAAPHILIVEDESFVALDLQEQLEEMGYAVAGVANNGSSALALARETEPDLVLMDVSLQGPMSGIDVATEMRRTLDVPVIFLSSYSDVQTIARAAEVQPYGYMTKPFQPDELRAMVQISLHKSQAERRWRASQHWYQSTLRCVEDAIVICEADGRIRFINPAAEKLSGCLHAQAKGQLLSDVLDIKMEDGSRFDLSLLLAKPAEQWPRGQAQAASLHNRDGDDIPVDQSTTPILNDDGSLLGAAVVLHDVRERRRFETLLQDSAERFRSIFDRAPQGMAVVDQNGRFIQANQALLKLFDCSESDLLQLSHDSLAHPDDLAAERRELERLTSGAVQSVQFEKRYRRPSNRKYFWSLVDVSTLQHGDGPANYLYHVADVTEQKDAKEQLVRAAYYDPLTGLGNRARLRDQLEREIAIARRNASELAVVFMDLDRFKQINDTLGHDMGDVLLQKVGQRLTKCIRTTDSVARMGGDEFVIVLPKAGRSDELAKLLNKIRAAVSKPVQLGSRELVVTPSLGVSVMPQDGRDAATLLRCADSALYAAKAAGRNRHAFFDAQMAQRANERLTLENKLRHALERGELYLDFQPIVELEHKRVESFEALLRWRDGDTVIPPLAFIGVAEEIGLITSIGAWVMREACRVAATWPHETAVSVNCSAIQFRDPELVNVVADALREFNLAPQRLHLELTEGIMLKGDSAQIERCNALRALGVELAVDDYGTGYSSLAYLKRYAPESLKIDATFVRDVAEDGNSQAIVAATVAMAHNLGMKVVAEGVENKMQSDRLAQLGCDRAQGFLYGRPGPAASAFAMLGQAVPADSLRSHAWLEPLLATASMNNGAWHA